MVGFDFSQLSCDRDPAPVSVLPDIQPVIGPAVVFSFVGTLFVVKALHESYIADHVDVKVVKLEAGDDKRPGLHIVDEPGFMSVARCRFG
jgi:hypothetical protein